MNHNCTLHPTIPLTSYCNSCRDAVCQKCTSLGPHADIRHQIMPLSQACNLRKMFYFAYRDKQIHPLVDKICLHLSTLSQKETLLGKQKKVIQKDISLEFEDINSRIQQAIAKKIVKKQTEIKNYEEILNRVQDLVYSFDAIMNFPHKFLLCYRQFHQQLKNLEIITLNIHKPAQSTITLKTSDLKAISSTWKVQPIQSESVSLPREMALSFARANQLPLFKQKNKFVNALVGKTTQYFHSQLAKAKAQILLNQKKILKLFNDQNQELRKFHRAKVCAFCLTPFSIQESNQPCSHNRNYKTQPQYKELEIPIEVRGCKMHYWVEAKASERPIPDLKTHSLVRILHKRQFKNSLKDIKEVKYQLNKYNIEKGKSKAYLDQFIKNDSAHLGFVTPLTFLFLMTNKFDVSETQTKVLSELCLDKQSGMIHYSKVEDILDDPEVRLREFEMEQEEIEKKKPTAPPSFKFRY